MTPREGRLKRISRNPERFDVVDLFGALGRKSGFRLGDAESESKFVEQVSASLHAEARNPAVVHGRQTEEMFAYVAASLGDVEAIKGEDSGDLIVADTELRPPDFRVVLRDKTEFFVEVKNFYQKRGSEPFRIKRTYAESLLKYGALFGRDLKLAIYWAGWNSWTLTSLDRVRLNREVIEITFIQAIKMNEMALLGDRMLGTVPPITMRILADAAKPRSINASGFVEFTVGGVEFYCSGRQLETPLERNLAFYFNLFSNWHEHEPKFSIVDGKLDFIDIVSEPEVSNPEQAFQLLGSMSGMISKHFRAITAPNHKPEILSPKSDPGALGFAIPRGYIGDRMPIWNIEIQPTFDE